MPHTKHKHGLLLFPLIENGQDKTWILLKRSEYSCGRFINLGTVVLNFRLGPSWDKIAGTDGWETHFLTSIREYLESRSCSGELGMSRYFVRHMNSWSAGSGRVRSVGAGTPLKW